MLFKLPVDPVYSIWRKLWTILREKFGTRTTVVGPPPGSPSYGGISEPKIGQSILTKALWAEILPSRQLNSMSVSSCRVHNVAIRSVRHSSLLIRDDKWMLDVFNMLRAPVVNNSWDPDYYCTQNNWLKGGQKSLILYHYKPRKIC